MRVEKWRREDLTDKIINACINVHRVLCPGFLESIYHNALKFKFITTPSPSFARRGLRRELQSNDEEEVFHQVLSNYVRHQNVLKTRINKMKISIKSNYIQREPPLPLLYFQSFLCITNL